jgi:RNA polymerase-binding transcription factor DksA
LEFRAAEEHIGNPEFMDFFAQKLLIIKANEQIQEDVLKALRQGQDVALEHTWYKAKRRVAYMEELKKVTDSPIYIYVVMPSEEQFRNNLIVSPKHSEKDFDRLWAEMDAIEMPNIAEGYDKIFIVRDEKVEELITEIDPDLIDRVKKELAEEVALEAAKEKEKKEHQEFLEQLNEQGFWHYCEVCGITETLWWKLATDKKKEHNMDDLTDEEKKTMKRILLESYSLLEEEEDK